MRNVWPSARLASKSFLDEERSFGLGMFFGRGGTSPRRGHWEVDGGFSESAESGVVRRGASLTESGISVQPIRGDRMDAIKRRGHIIRFAPKPKVGSLNTESPIAKMNRP